MITSGLSVLAVYMSTSFTSFSFDGAVILGFLGLGLTWVSTLLKRKIWVYLFLVILGLSFTPIINVSYINFTLSLGSVEINLFILSLFIAHMVLNFGEPAETAPPAPEGGWTKVNVLKHENQDKSDVEINVMLEGELSSEKRQALEEILESRKIH